MATRNDSLEMMRLHSQTNFRFDGGGRLLSTNEEPPFLAPRMFLGRTAGGNVWHLRHDLPGERAENLAALLEREPPLGAPGEEPACLAQAIVILARDQPVTVIYRGPAFVFDASPGSQLAVSEAIGREALDPLPRSASPRAIGEGEAVRFHRQLREMGWSEPLNAAQQPCYVVEADGAIVALCHSSRSSRSAGEAGVSTAPDYRRRGFGRRVVEAWAEEVMAGGRTAFYSTTWENAASRAIAGGLGLRFFGEDCHIT